MTAAARAATPPLHLAVLAALGAAALVVVSLATSCTAPGKASTTLSASELLRQIQSGTAPLILDVRTPAEVAAGHVPGARNIPHDELATRLDEVLAMGALGARTGARYAIVGHLVVYCRTGRRSRLAAAVLERASFDRILYLEGEWTGWVAQGLPVEKARLPVFFDDFEGAAVDTTRWQLVRRNWGGQVDGEMSYNGGVLPDNVRVGDGYLVLTARGDHHDGPARGVNRNGSLRADGKRTGAALHTATAFASGSYEVRLKVAPELGACSALWTYHYEELPVGARGYRALAGKHLGPYPVNHEIDIELPGRPGPAHEDIAFDRALMVTWEGLEDDEYTTCYARLAAPQDDGAFHTYRFDWHTGDPGGTDHVSQDRRVEFYVDDELVTTTTTTVPTRAGHFWVGVWFPRGWAGVPDFDTAEMVVDWVRITPFGEAGDETASP